MKRFLTLSCLAFGAQSVLAFSLLGPVNEPWQTPDIGYNPAWDPLQTAPKNIGEEYRRNTPVLYYTFDASFLEYFGTRGVRSIEEAVAVFNGLTNVSSYSPELSEFPLQVTRENYQASALQLLDLKSQTMKVLIEQLGLAEPERYIWTLHDRFDTPGDTCPLGMEYILVRRNWDIMTSPLNQLQASSYVNGTLYSYSIFEFCAPPNPIAEAIEFPVDPLDFSYTAVASGPGSVLSTLNHG
ncbi:hypothetical protein EG834_17445, partial [bacterium]|nr:hypothetical protein [bacterium]